MPHCCRLTAVRFAWVAVLLFVGCHGIGPHDPAAQASLLKAVSAARDSVALEIYWANFPSQNQSVSDDFWASVQENRLDPDLRRRLARNGLRAGVLTGALPDSVHRLLNPSGGDADDVTETNTVLQQSGVWRRMRQLRPGDEIELQACEPKPSAPLLIAKGEDLVGETFTNAQAFYRLRASIELDGRSRLRLTPEVRHGVAKPRWTPDETGTIAMATPRRDAQVFDELAMEVPLAPGEALLVTSLPDSGSRLGGYFHSSDDSTDGSKAILIRVVQAPSTDDFSLSEEDLPTE